MQFSGTTKYEALFIPNRKSETEYLRESRRGSKRDPPRMDLVVSVILVAEVSKCYPSYYSVLNKYNAELGTWWDFTADGTEENI